MMTAGFVFVFIFIASCAAQRPPFAGKSPIGYPALSTTTADPLANRFGDDVPTTTIRLPLEALGDAELVNRLSKLPLDQQPFWLLNWKALEENRKNPKTYKHNNNVFIDTNTAKRV